MPGVGGSRAILGVGFWAQQEYFNVASFPSPDQNPNKLFRPPLKSLPDQPFPPNAFQSWTYAYNKNLIGKDQLPIGDQFFDRPPLGPIAPENLKTWTAAYNQNLIGKDQLPAGETLSDLPPRDYQRLDIQTWLQVTTALTMAPPAVVNFILRPIWRSLPDQPPTPLAQQSAFPNYLVLQPTVTFIMRQSDWPLPSPRFRDPTLATIARGYTLELIGQDQLPVGDQTYELTPIWPRYINDLRTWQWSYNQNLIGKDRLPAGEQIYELVPAQRPPEQAQLHAWAWSYNQNLIGKDQLPIGDQISDLAPAQKPAEQPQLRAWAWSYNLNLIGQDRLPVGDQVWERPTLPIPPAQTWLDLPKYSLIAKPFAQTDWPNPTQPYRVEQTWARGYTLSLIGQDRMIAGEQITDLPPRDFARLLQTWINTVSLALVTAPPDLNAQVHSFDYPNPRGAEPDWRRSWEFAFNKNLIGQDQLPAGKQSVELAPRDYQRALQTWIQGLNLALTQVAPTL